MLERVKELNDEYYRKKPKNVKSKGYYITTFDHDSRSATPCGVEFELIYEGEL